LGMYLRKLIYKQNGAISTFILRRNQLMWKAHFKKKMLKNLHTW
jgi:hypothetical protein